MFYFFFFFFSSRRRHTRSLRDWSSDVCSSDLGGQVGPRGQEGSAAQDRRKPPQVQAREDGQPDGASFVSASPTRFRHSSAASPTGTRSVCPVFRSRSSRTPSFSPRSPIVTRSGTPIRSASLNLAPGRSSRSSSRTSTPPSSRRP